MSFSLSWARRVNNSARLSVWLLWQLQVGELARRERERERATLRGFCSRLSCEALQWENTMGSCWTLRCRTDYSEQSVSTSPFRVGCSCIFHKCSFQHIQLLLLSEKIHYSWIWLIPTFCSHSLFSLFTSKEWVFQILQACLKTIIRCLTEIKMMSKQVLHACSKST